MNPTSLKAIVYITLFILLVFIVVRLAKWNDKKQCLKRCDENLTVAFESERESCKENCK